MAYILAGGEGRRFGGDKLVALVDGEASVARVASALRAAGFHGVYVVTRERWRCRLYSSLARLDGCLYDEPPVEGCSGPAVAIYTALRHASAIGASLALIVPGDAPWLTSHTFSSLAALAPADGSSTVIHGDGYLESLLQAHRGKAIESAAEGIARFCRLRGGKARPTDGLRSTVKLALAGTLLVSCSAVCFAHINTRENLRARQPKSPPMARELLLLEPPAARAEDTSLCSLLRTEANYYSRLNVRHLAEQAERDLAELCSSTSV